MTPSEFKKNRKVLGFTQYTLAYELDISQAYISQFERGIISLVSDRLVNNFRVLIADSAFIKALHNIKSMVIDKNMSRVIYEDI